MPVLLCLKERTELHRSKIVIWVSDYFNLTDEQRSQLLPSESKPVVRSRVGWAISYLKQAGLVMPVKRGVYRLTDSGRKVLAESPKRIDLKYLEQFEEFVAFRNRAREKTTKPTHIGVEDSATPSEAFESAYLQLRSGVESELLESVLASSPEFFEKLVVNLLVAMGYGGSMRDAGKAIGQSGDGGIDGIIKEDKLGLDAIYVQAKRWQNTVGRPDIQKFAGALQGERARKGVFLTTSRFSREAIDYVNRIDPKIVLIDGEELARLMYDYEVGVGKAAVYSIKQVDSDFFDDI